MHNDSEINRNSSCIFSILSLFSAPCWVMMLTSHLSCRHGRGGERRQCTSNITITGPWQHHHQPRYNAGEKLDFVSEICDHLEKIYHIKS